MDAGSPQATESTYMGMPSMQSPLPGAHLVFRR